MKVTLISATTLDGKIALDSEHLPTWTSPGDMKYFTKRTKEAGALIMGSSTFKTINSSLSQRKIIVLTRDPEYKNKVKGVSFTKESPKVILDNLSAEGFHEVIIAGGSQINTLFLPFIDQIELTINPVMFGKGISVFKDNKDITLKLLEVTKLTDEIILAIYKPDK